MIHKIKNLSRFNKQLGFNQVLPKTDQFFERCIMLPMNIFISDSDVDYVCETVVDFYKK